jgi:Rrf2 family nitric oxide-sensitive transcriptional repressor
MQLTRFTDLGLRVLMYLTQIDGARGVTVAEIAEQFQVPANHLHKVVNRMGKLGWVDAHRGRNGGLWLAPGATSLKLGEVLRALEHTEQLIDCESPPCPLSGRCLLKDALNTGLEAFYLAMDAYTLMDMCKSGTKTVLLRLSRNYDADV